MARMKLFVLLASSIKQESPRVYAGFDVLAVTPEKEAFGLVATEAELLHESGTIIVFILPAVRCQYTCIGEGAANYSAIN